MHGRFSAGTYSTGRCIVQFIFTTVLLCTGVAQAQSLDVFLAAAKRQNYDAREAAALTRQRAAEASQTTAGLYPILTARGLYTRNQFAAEVVVPTTPGAPPEKITILPRDQFDGFLILDVPLINVPQWAQIRSSNAVAEAARIQEAATNINVEGAVIQAYYNLLGARALVKAAKEAIDATEVITARIKERVAAGVASPVDEARAISELSLKRQTLADAEQVAAVAARNLETLTSIEPRNVVPPPRDSLQPEPPAELWFSKLDEIPAVKAALADARAQRIRADAAWTVFVPTLKFQGVERFTNATGFANASAFFTGVLNLEERIDLSAVSAAKAERAAAEGAQIRAERIRQNVHDTIYSNWQRVHALIAQAAAARASSDANEVALRILRDRYENGTASSLDLSSADRDHFNALATVIQAEAALATARANLRLSAGLPYNAPGPQAPPSERTQ